MDPTTLILVLVISTHPGHVVTSRSDHASATDCEAARRRVDWRGTTGLAYCVPTEQARHALSWVTTPTPETKR